MSENARTLHEILEAGQPLPPEKALRLSLDLLNTLESAHRQGRQFGGLYPDQVRFEADGLAELFALSAPRLPDDVTLSYLAFMPPEVMEGETPTKQADIYSAG